MTREAESLVLQCVYKYKIHDHLKTLFYELVASVVGVHTVCSSVSNTLH